MSSILKDLSGESGQTLDDLASLLKGVKIIELDGDQIPGTECQGTVAMRSERAEMWNTVHSVQRSSAFSSRRKNDLRG